MNSVDVKVVRGKSGFYGIKEDWYRLVDMQPNKQLLHTYQWHQSYIETFDDDESVLFLLLYRNKSLIAIFPFEVLVKDFLGLPFRQLEILHDYDSEIVDFIGDVSACKGDLVELLADNLRKAVGNYWVRIVFPCVSAQSSTYSLVEKSHYRPIVSEKAKSCFYLKCTSYDEATKEISGKVKKEIRRGKKRLSQLGDVRMLFLRTKSDLQWAFQELLQLEASGWKGRQGTAIRGRERSEKFYGNLVEYFSEIGGCEISLLRVNARSIAASLNLRVDSTAYCIKLGYDESHSRCSPGVVMADALIERYGNDSSIDTMNMLSSEKWMARWKPSSMEMFHVCIFRKSLIGYLAYAVHRSGTMRQMQDRYKSIREKLRSSKKLGSLH